MLNLVSEVFLMVAMIGIGLPIALFIVAPLFLVVLGVMVVLFSPFSSVAVKPLKVLVVDDDEGSVLPLLDILEKSHAKVQVVTSGSSMVSELGSHHYDLLFLDYKMPGLSGVDALKLSDSNQLKKANLRFKTTPVVLFTGYGQEVEVPKCQTFEIRGLWSKLLSYDRLQKRVRKLFKSIPDTSLEAAA
ncbi:MAG: response regulator [Bacteriovoracia bacterium]